MHIKTEQTPEELHTRTRTRTAIELVHLYFERVCQKHEHELVRELCADSMTRHDPNGVVVFSHDSLIAWLEKSQGQTGANFNIVTAHGDDEFVTVIYDVWTTRGRDNKTCNIETWQVQDGVLTNCWSCPSFEGRWGEPDKPESLQEIHRPARMLKAIERADRFWLTDVFFQAGLETPRIELVNPTPLTGGNAGKTLRLDIDYNAEPDADVPQTLICKMTSDSPHMAYMMMQVGANIAEINATRLFSENAIINAPKFYFGETDEHGFYFNLLLEDLGQKGGYDGDQLNGVSVAQAEAVCDQFGKLHSHFWNSSELDEFSWLTSSKQSSADAYIAGTQAARDYFGDLLTESKYQLIEAFSPCVKDWLEYQGDNKSLIHGDARATNVMLCPTDDGRDEAYLIDWQTVTASGPMRDLGSFLSSSVTTDDRRTIERRLLEKHTEAITAVDASYTLDAALEEYRFYLLAGVWGAVATCAYADSDNDELRAVLNSWITRSLAAVEDWDSMALVTERLKSR